MIVRIASRPTGAIVALLSLASIASAATYNENVQGDLPSSNPLTVINLDLGANTVNGIMGTIQGSSDFDAFGFVVSPGQTVPGITVSMADFGGDATSAIWDLRTGLNAFSGTLVQSASVPSPGNFTFGVLGPGSYHFDSGGFAGTGGFTYIFNLTTTVPEPASLGLLALGSVGLLRRRK